MAKKKAKPDGKWVFVPTSEMTLEEQQAHYDDAVMKYISGMPSADMRGRIAAFENYLPGENKLPEGGDWIMVRVAPHTQYTVPPMSIWFAEPWPMNNERFASNRVKVLTPRGDLGLFPCEYSRIRNPATFLEFVGKGMSLHFFGQETGVPVEKLFYLQAKGVSRKDALGMLIGEIRAHGVLWMETDREIVAQFYYDYPAEAALATRRAEA